MAGARVDSYGGLGAPFGAVPALGNPLFDDDSRAVRVVQSYEGFHGVPYISWTEQDGDLFEAFPEGELDLFDTDVVIETNSAVMSAPVKRGRPSKS